MRKVILLWLSLALYCCVQAQTQLPDSLKRELAKTSKVAERLKWLHALGNYYSGINNKQSDEYGNQMIEIADSSRDRECMTNAYLYNADRYYDMPSQQQNISKGIECSQKALDVAKANNLEEGMAWAYLALARGNRLNGEMDKALNYNNTASSVANGTDNDSLKVRVYNALGTTYLAKAEKLLALRNYLAALTLAEKEDNFDLLDDCYTRLGGFYSSLEDYEKAKDYEFKKEALERSKNKTYSLLDTYNEIGKLYSLAKQYDQGLKYYEKSIAMADSMHNELFKLNGQLNILNLYLNNNQFQKGMEYFRANQALINFFNKAGMDYIVDEAYGAMYTLLDKLDSATYYLKKAEPGFESKAAKYSKYYFYNMYSYCYKKKKDYDHSIEYMQKGKTIAEQLGSLELMESAVNNLDSLYQWKGDFKNAFLYNSMYHQYKDSLQKLSKEKDVLSLEIDNENKRKDREAKKLVEDIRRRHNIQYMGITIAIAAVFILMVMLGAFSVSRTTVKILGFFAFIFLFEFIILLADNQIHDWTSGEPWKVLAIKIGLIAILLPLHHWMEEKVTHYLTTQELLRVNGKGFMRKLFKKKDADLPMGNL